jgi:hypothetical protein
MAFRQELIDDTVDRRRRNGERAASLPVGERDHFLQSVAAHLTGAPTDDAAAFIFSSNSVVSVLDARQSIRLGERLTLAQLKKRLPLRVPPIQRAPTAQRHRSVFVMFLEPI